MNRELLRRLPKVDEILNDPEVADQIASMPHEQAVDVVRSVLDEKRRAILSGEETSEDFVSHDRVMRDVTEHIILSCRKSLRPVVNGTGVILHTNLGRAELSKKAKQAVAEVADRYSTLEYDPEAGHRGSRHTHVEGIIRKITGAEACMVVNNNAAATMIVLAAIGAGKEMIVSRGELVEIGGAFRIPDIMEQSGATLREVGTTNKTRLKDYENAITENTGALMKVHTSNYRVIGFTEDVPVEDLADLGRKRGLPVIYDLGGGLMVDLSDRGIDEPTVEYGMKSGADVILFSGDKLLGGPQAGIIIGKKKYIDRMKKHPLARILRVDKMTLAGLEATFEQYYDPEEAKRSIPVLRMLTRSKEDLTRDAERMRAKILERVPDAEVAVERSMGMIGGGTTPGILLEGAAAVLSSRKRSAAYIEEQLRLGDLPIIVRVHENRIVIDMRTVSEPEQDMIAEKLAEILA